MKTFLFEYVKKFRLRSVFVKNLILIFFIILLPISFCGTVIYMNSKKDIDSETRHLMNTHLTTVRSSVDSVVEVSEMIALQTSLNPSTETFFLSNYDDKTVTKLQKEIRDYITDFMYVHPYIHSIYVYGERDGIVIDSNTIVKLDNMDDVGWYSVYNEMSDGEMCVISRKRADTYPNFISVVKNVAIVDVGRIGCVVVNIDVKKINENINADVFSSKNDVLIVNNKSQVLLSRERDKIGKTLDSFFEKSQIEKIKKTDFGLIDIANESFLFLKIDSSEHGFSYISLMDETNFDAIKQSSFRVIIIMIIMLAFLVVIVSMLISFRTYVPIKRVLKVLLPHYKIDDVDSDATSEIEYIINSITRSIDKTTELKDELNYSLGLLNQAQIYALQTQINPHFINNILEIINWNVIMKLGADNHVSTMIRTLSSLLHVSLDNEHYIVSIQEEMHHTNLYIYMMQESYDDLDFVWDIEEGITDYKMLKLTFQPIVENAIQHGIKPKRGKGKVEISGRYYKKGILFTISDDGVGMTTDKLNELKKQLEDGVLSSVHIGIKNVNERIKLVFGSEYGVSVESIEGKGTQVKVYIPCVDI